MIVLLMIGMLLLPGFAAAIRPTSALYDKTGLTTTIDATCIGTLMVNHDMEWQQSNSPNGNLKNNTLQGDEVRTDITYHEDTMAVAGSTKYTKGFSMDGSNASAGSDNLGVNHMVNYQADQTQGGKMLWDEEGTITQHGRGTTNDTSALRCVFASGGETGAGGFAGTVSAGSLMDVEEVAAVTQMGGRSIAADSKTPVSLRYSFDAQGLDTDTKDKLATGAASVYQNTEFETYDKTTVDSNTTTMIRDSQNTQARGLFDLAQTVGYTSTY
ncbi:MAG: hypothetical protein CVV33_01135 [Methanomicrobiales archaeon HGW-Methanomicrobiales-4]|nr:MAG: hypothetical protein CVV33_01135 [Methanomicrobiales archaeon HGW-Methanomicrobiales-4]